MTSTPRFSPSRGPAPMRRLLRIAPGGVLSAVLLTGCGSTAAAPAEDTATSGAQNAGTRTFPGTSGLLADISGSTLQVQSTTAQTAVNYTSATTFTSTVAGAARDLAVGKCISVRDAAAAIAASTTAAVPVAPTDPVTAGSITITDAVDGACTGALGGGFGARDGGPGGGLRGANGRDGSQPAEAGTGSADPDRQNGLGGGRGVNGLITKISGDTITVEARSPAPPGTSTTTPASTTRTVATVGTTTYTKTVKASNSALAVGTCVTALGTADDTGTIAATSISVRTAQDGICTGGLGRQGGTNPGAGPGAGA